MPPKPANSASGTEKADASPTSRAGNKDFSDGVTHPDQMDDVRKLPPKEQAEVMKKTAENSSNTPSFLSKILKGLPFALAIGVLAITGLIFLPPFLINAVSNALFPFLPPEFRPMASGCCSSSSCCSGALAVIMLVLSR